MLIITAHKALEQITLTREELKFAETISQTYSELVYNGLWHEPLREDLDAIVNKMQVRVTGKVRVKLHKGGMPGETDDKRIIINLGGRILDSKHYLPGLRQVVSRKLYIKDEEDLKRCEEEYKKPDARRSLETLSHISRNVHSHTISARDVEGTMNISIYF